MNRFYLLFIVLMVAASATESAFAKTLKEYKDNWNMHRPLFDQYEVLKAMDMDGIISGALKDAFAKAEKECEVAAQKDLASHFKNPGKICTDALKTAYKETFRQLIMPK